VGKSLLPIFDGKTRAPHAQIFWEHEGNRAIREGKWKLVATNKGQWELYDLEADRTELRNLAKEQPERAAALNNAWVEWAKRCGASIRDDAMSSLKE
jgi:arylsulfatase